MANTVNVGITTSACTFNQWRITDNLMANDVNEIARGDFIKNRGNIELTNGKITLSNSSGGVILDVHDDTNIDGTLTVKDIEVDNTTGHVYVDAGDIEGVTAGVGISGGGTSGTVTVTNSMATAIDAKGDLIAGTGADTFARLAVGGTNGHTLQVDSSTATARHSTLAHSAKVMQQMPLANAMPL